MLKMSADSCPNITVWEVHLNPVLYIFFIYITASTTNFSVTYVIIFYDATTCVTL